MAHPWKDPKSGVWQLRQKTPRDLVGRLRGTTLTLPIGDGSQVDLKVGDIVRASLRTKDDRVARTRHAIADAALQAFWDAARSPQAIVASEQATEAARPGTLSGPAGGMAWEEAVARFRPGSKKLLGDLSEPATEANQARIVSATASIMDEAWAMLRGERLEEPTAPSSPKTSGLTARPRHGGAAAQGPRGMPITVSDLWSRYRLYHSDKLATNTLHRYEASISRLAAYLPDRDVRHITGDDIYSWAEHRQSSEGIHPRTINRNDLVAASSLFSWATKRQGGQIVDANPVEGVALDLPRHVKTRERTFRDAEVLAILRAAQEVAPWGPHDKANQGKRWCPWLAAYSGARISELTALEATDIRQEQGSHIMHFSRTKTSEPRSVPIHPHLIERGFLDFVAAIGSGPLFFDPARHSKSARTPPHEVRSRKIAEWLRKKVNLDPAVDPNHGWRHTFKTRAVNLMDARVRDEIVGHTPGAVRRKYEAPTIPMMAEAMANFPRYDV
ncbi:site-specific integrase [Methylobacterium dankookense]|nr:site-specific integrase [Methylobacterium dankookense]